ncbi:hypothetical protein [Iningainema tapete]|uniref:Uncharacterized protein n=1 Tax=Iningainema tapete BLCC-T55 TaxID=2748662 RepID=A0A8J6XGL8_9CYAN|nr:hypothetical protein [Iningainema tapete]MBD2771409.1 hypothetical protein [Iningainema tapete BLCC-T55]
MQSSTCACSAVTIRQQQEQNIHHQKQCNDAKPNHCKNKSGNCTVVENGRVVIKPVNQSSDSRDTTS